MAERPSGQGIFFKFAIDLHGYYGGDEYAAKAAGHDLNGLIAYYKCVRMSSLLRSVFLPLG